MNTIAAASATDPARLDRLYALLPVVHRMRDAERGYPLKALLRVIAEQVNVVEDDIALVAFPFGAMSTRYFARAAAAYAGDGSAIVATREGPSETSFVMQQRWLGQPVYSRLVTNGFSMS